MPAVKALFDGEHEGIGFQLSKLGASPISHEYGGLFERMWRREPVPSRSTFSVA